MGRATSARSFSPAAWATLTALALRVSRGASTRLVLLLVLLATRTAKALLFTRGASARLVLVPVVLAATTALMLRRLGGGSSSSPIPVVGSGARPAAMPRRTRELLVGSTKAAIHLEVAAVRRQWTAGPLATSLAVALTVEIRA